MSHPSVIPAEAGIQVRRTWREAFLEVGVRAGFKPAPTIHWDEGRPATFHVGLVVHPAGLNRLLSAPFGTETLEQRIQVHVVRAAIVRHEPRAQRE